MRWFSSGTGTRSPEWPVTASSTSTGNTLGHYTVLVYAVVALLPFFVSTTTLARTIGTTFVVSLVVTIAVYREALTSVWCFFAAILSALILVAVIRTRRDVISPGATVPESVGD